MPNRITLKKSAVANKVPLVTDLSPGELAINTTDGRLYYLHSSSSIGEINASDARSVGGINASSLLRNDQNNTINGELTINGNTILSGSSLTINATTYNYGAGAAAAHRTALGLGTAATTDSTSYAAASHSHGNITNAGAIGTTADLAIVTSVNGILTTQSRSGIDSRTSFPNDAVTGATSDATANSIVRRDSLASADFVQISASAVNADNATFEGLTLNNNATFNATTYNFGTGAAIAFRNAIGVSESGSQNYVDDQNILAVSLFA
jgi:hypothetical protein